MNLRLCHAESDKEITNYSYIKTLSWFSFGFYDGEKKGCVLSDFSHAHDAYEFIIPLSTIVFLNCNNGEYIGETGFCYPVPPNIPHGIKTDGKFKGISIAVDREYVSEYKKELGIKATDDFSYKFVVSKKMKEILKQFMNESKTINADEEHLSSLAKDILKEIIILGLFEKGSFRYQHVYSKIIDDSVMYMYKNYTDESLTIEKIAEASGYSFTYFSKLFKSSMGDTPIGVLNRIRISEAKMFFRIDKYSIKDIAYMVGYNNFSSFTMAFKRITGMTPKDYRKIYY